MESEQVVIWLDEICSELARSAVDLRETGDNLIRHVVGHREIAESNGVPADMRVNVAGNASGIIQDAIRKIHGALVLLHTTLGDGEFTVVSDDARIEGSHDG